MNEREQVSGEFLRRMASDAQRRLPKNGGDVAKILRSVNAEAIRHLRNGTLPDGMHESYNELS